MTRSILWFVPLALAMIPSLSAATEELDRERLDELLASDRGGMVKFYQPWCGHCTRMKPDWDLLAEHFQDEPSVFIADVNCQVEEALCNGYHTGGTYPTVLVFPPPPPTRRNDSGETTNARRRPPAQLYQGGRGLEDLRKFADQSLVQPCRVDDVETTCSARAQKYIAKWTTKPRKEQTTEMARLKSITNTESSLTYDLSKWLTDRIAILEQLVAEKGQGNEL